MVEYYLVQNRWERDFYGVLMWFENSALFRNKESPNNSYVIFYIQENYLQETSCDLCWSFDSDEMWFVVIFILSRNVSYIETTTTSELLSDLWSKRIANSRYRSGGARQVPL